YRRRAQPGDPSRQHDAFPAFNRGTGSDGRHARLCPAFHRHRAHRRHPGRSDAGTGRGGIVAGSGGAASAVRAGLLLRIGAGSHGTPATARKSNGSNACLRRLHTGNDPPWRWVAPPADESSWPGVSRLPTPGRWGRRTGRTTAGAWVAGTRPAVAERAVAERAVTE